MTERVAVIGMGQMGSGMAGRLTETGHDVLGYDINAELRRELRECQVAVAETLKDALAGRRIIVTSLPDPAAAG
jgi:3-hydroxyisobutyrate dehydrogenase-like beta-hydroxyacid dehydrogenase